ncbi:MAG: hypothetical protein F9K25_17140 [Candidatus Contendobacter sp.]|nr:MAG: hypothetical protein F9K25_17140 [Candidatus Contendobacter sp.]
MYIPELHNRNHAAKVRFGDMPTSAELAALLAREWPTASPARQKELAEALQVAVRARRPEPEPPAKPARKVADLVREWYAAPPAARRIFNDHISEFLGAHRWAP